MMVASTDRWLSEGKHRVKLAVDALKNENAKLRARMAEDNRKIALLGAGKVIVNGTEVRATKESILKTPEIVEKKRLASGRHRGHSVFQEYTGMAQKPVTDLKAILSSGWKSDAATAKMHVGTENLPAIKVYSVPFYAVILGKLLEIGSKLGKVTELPPIVDWHGDDAVYIMDIGLKNGKKIVKALKPYIGYTVLLYGGGFGDVGDIYPCILRNVYYREHDDQDGTRVAQVRPWLYHVDDRPGYNTGGQAMIVEARPWLGSWRVAIAPPRSMLKAPVTFPAAFLAHPRRESEASWDDMSDYTASA